MDLTSELIRLADQDVRIRLLLGGPDGRGRGPARRRGRACGYGWPADQAGYGLAAWSGHLLTTPGVQLNPAYLVAHLATVVVSGALAVVLAVRHFNQGRRRWHRSLLSCA
ncbi:hypothetical protein GCM10027059_15180 [Myceligenerans halotolerans]